MILNALYRQWESHLGTVNELRLVMPSNQIVSTKWIDSPQRGYFSAQADFLTEIKRLSGNAYTIKIPTKPQTIPSP